MIESIYITEQIILYKYIHLYIMSIVMQKTTKVTCIYSIVIYRSM